LSEETQARLFGSYMESLNQEWRSSRGDMLARTCFIGAFLALLVAVVLIVE
jgi:hypothetical protein